MTPQHQSHRNTIPTTNQNNNNHKSNQTINPSLSLPSSLQNLNINTNQKNPFNLDISSPTPIQNKKPLEELFQNREICNDPDQINPTSTSNIPIPIPSPKSSSRLRQITSSIFLRPSHSRYHSETKFDSDGSSGGDGEESSFINITQDDLDRHVTDHQSTSKPSPSSSRLKSSPFKSNRSTLNRPKSIASLASASLMGVLQPPNTTPDLAAILQIKNLTGWTLQTVQWPTKMTQRGRKTFLLSHFRTSIRS